MLLLPALRRQPQGQAFYETSLTGHGGDSQSATEKILQNASAYVFV